MKATCVFCDSDLERYNHRYCSIKCNIYSKLTPSDNGCLEYNRLLDKWGYGTIRFRGKDIKAHRAMWMAHNGSIPKGLVIRHICDNPCCCNIEHLKLGTFKENSQDMVDRNRQTIGIKNPMSKLTESDIHEIRHLFSQGLTSLSIAKKYNVTPTNIGCIRNGKTWSHITTTLLD